jgi:predicted nucleotidyltransferase
LGEKSFDNLMELAFYLEDLFGRKVKIVTPQSLSKHNGLHILRGLKLSINPDIKLFGH